MKSIKAGLACLLFVLTSAVYAQDVESDCKTVEIQAISLYFVEQVRKESVSQTYKNIVDMVNKIAEKHKFKNFKITSQDLSVSRNSYSTNMYEVGVSVYLEMPFSYKSIDIFVSEADPATISSSKSVQEVCN